MKEILLAIVFTLSITLLNAQTSQPINIGTIDSINSKILGEERAVWVYVPNTGADDRFAKVKYPVIYLLDGELAFSSVTGMTQYLSSTPLGNCPEVIVVGIINKDRFKDLTPSNVRKDTADKNTSGGGENFLAFIEKELMPYINKNYPTLPYNIFAGHSLGGLMVMQAFMHHYNMFNAYIVLDPSMWWDNQKLLKETKTSLKRTDVADKPLYLATANTMKAGFDTISVKKDTSGSMLHIQSILELEQLLKANKTRFSSIYYSNYGHQPSLLTGTYDALLWLFKSYRFPIRISDLSGPTFDTLQNRLDTHFGKVSKELGFKYNPPEKLVDYLTKTCVDRKLMNAAEYLFKMNIANYPTSFNAYDAMGDFYLKQDNKEKAIECFKKALAIKDVEATRFKLKQVEEK